MVCLSGELFFVNGEQSGARLFQSTIRPATETRENFYLVQALRGIAALWVVLFHLEKSDAITAAPVVHPVFGYGSAGVAIFFVLSGFVIAHSLNGKTMTPRALGKFVLRRSVRLDPPYWASMVLVVAVGAIMALAHHRAPVFPTSAKVAAHVLYLQDLLRVGEIQVVYWTLCYEIQFYLVFAASLMVRGSFWPLYGLALWSAFQGHDWALHGLFVNLWHGFFLGVLAYRCGYLKERAWPLLLLAAVTLIFRGSGVFGVPCAFTALLLFGCARMGKLGLLSSRGWQWLGAISYSLYLVHVPTIELFMGAWQRLAGRGEVQDTLGGIFLLSACLFVAGVFYQAVERPSHGVAKRLFKKPQVYSPAM